MVFVGSDQTFYGVSESGGAVAWTAPIPTVHSSPAVSATGVYADAFPYQGPSFGSNYGFPFDLAPATGQVIWQNTGGLLVAPSLEQPTVALFEEQLFVRSFEPFYMTGVLMNAISALSSYFSGLGPNGTIPALSASTLFTLTDLPSMTTPTLSAITIASRTTQWTFTGDGALTSAPLLVGQHGVVGSSLGNIFIVDAATGQLVSSAAVGAPIAVPDEGDNVILTGLTAADGMLFVPAGSRVIAY
jgi:outer membrane protein assembly factor BamB